MSRSKKKIPIIKDKGWVTKTARNRALRRVNKIRVNKGERPISKREYIDDYDLCDWKFMLYPEDPQTFEYAYKFWAK